MIEQTKDHWAIVELMGHGQTAGRITRPVDWVGIMVDVPDGEGFRTELYGMPAIYAVKFCSEEIARAYARRNVEISPYDTPIVTREQHEAVVSRLQNELYRSDSNNRELQRRLTAVNALPAPVETYTDEVNVEEDPDWD